jgi:hypothetical protein
MRDGGAASGDSRPQAAGPAQTANLALRFLLELAALAALAYWGVHAGHSVLADVVLGFGAPLLAAVVWGTWAAPKSARRLHGTALLVVQLAVLGAGAAALVAAGHPGLGVAMAAVIAVNAVLLRLWGGD